VSASDLNAALGAARRAAVLRGEPVTFLADDRGAWQVDGDASPAASPIVTGTLDAPVGRLRIRVSATGTCVPEPIDGVPLPNWNALRCGFGESSQTGRP
jgi:hypothetical protein